MKIGIFGGSFNPVHNGHVNALKEFIKKAELDRVFVIPTFLSPHKDMSHVPASFEDRVAMLEIALDGIEGVEISQIEKKLFEESGEKSYTKITLQQLKSQYDGEYYLYTGTDMFTTLESWREFHYLFENTVIAVMSRDGDKKTVEEYKAKYEKEYNARILVIDSKHLTASSTEVRQSIQDGTDSPLIHQGVADYIRENHIYTKRPTYGEILERAKRTLPEKRFFHTLAVEKEVRYLSRLLCPEFEEELSRMALLHDVTKYLPLEEHIGLAEGVLDENDMKSPETIHAKSGGILVRNMGDGMWRTVTYHTTGKPDMSLFEMIIFLADYVEETRTHESCIVERALLHRELEKTSRENRLAVLRASVRRVLENTVKYLTSKKVFIHPLTLEALDYYNTLEGTEMKKETKTIKKKALRDIKTKTTPEVKKPKKKKTLLLSILGILVAAIIALGLWIALSEPEIDTSANPFASSFMEMFGRPEAYTFVDRDRMSREKAMGTVYTLQDFFGKGLLAGDVYDEIGRNETAYNILVVGKDRVGSNTDVIMVVNFDSRTQKINILQIPRDTYVEDPINKYSTKRINAVYALASNANRKKYDTKEEIAHASLQYLESTIESTFGITIDNYFMIDLNGFVKVIDSIGGVEVNVPFRMYYNDDEQNLHINLYPGEQTLNGNQAEQFVRFRNTYVLGDLGRVSAQKIFLAALIEKLTSPEWFSVDSLTSVASNVIQYTTSGMSLTDLMGYIKKVDFGKLSGDSITFYTAQGEGYFSSSGASFYSLYLEENLEIINKAFNLYNKEVTAENVTLSEQYRSAYTTIDTNGSTATEIEEEPPKIIVAGGGGGSKPKPKPQPPTEEKPTVDEPVEDEPIVDEPTTDEPTADEPVVDEPVVDEPIVDEPITDEPIVDEPTTDEPIADEPIEDEPVVEEPVVEEPIVEEPVVEEPKTEEPEEEYISVVSPNELG